jgi:NADH:ubiquinone reductase (H+-translocating)
MRVGDPSFRALNPASHCHHVVIVGAGFGGLEVAHRLAGTPVRITIIDQRNHHLFQPLLYQVATASLATRRLLGRSAISCADARK